MRRECWNVEASAERMHLHDFAERRIVAHQEEVKELTAALRDTIYHTSQILERVNLTIQHNAAHAAMMRACFDQFEASEKYGRPAATRDTDEGYH